MDMFANAQPVAPKKPAKGKKDETLVPTPGLELYAALCAVETNIKAQKAVVRTGIDADAMERFIDEGMRTGRAPESYKGVEGAATGSIQLRCRGANSPVTEDEQAILEEAGIPLETIVSREETFIFNPAYTDLTDEENAAMFKKISEALSSLGLPKDLIQRQTGDSKVVATDESIAAVVRLKEREKVEALIPLVTCQALRPSLSKDANPFEIVEKALGDPSK